MHHPRCPNPGFKRLDSKCSAAKSRTFGKGGAGSIARSRAQMVQVRVSNALTLVTVSYRRAGAAEQPPVQLKATKSN